MAIFRRGAFWWAEFTINGHRYRRSTRLASKSRAIEFETRLRAELHDLHALGRTREMRFGEAMDRYFETVILTKPKKPDGLYRRHNSKNDILRIKRLEAFFGRDASLRHVSKPAVIAELNFFLLKTMQPQSANRYLSLLRAILNKTYEWGALPYPPIVRLNAEQRPVNRALTEPQERKLIEYAPERIRDLVIFVLDTGARREEAFYLTWDRVDLDRRPRPVVYFTDTKSGEHRCLPVPRRTAKMLRRRKRLYGRQSNLVFCHPATRDLYNNKGRFYAHRDEMVIVSNFQVVWRRLREKLEMENFRLHDLRHTYATKLVRRGVPLYDVSKLLGHKSLRMTMRYAYLSIAELDRAVAVLDD